MRVGNFSLLIPEGRERDSGHTFIEHGKQYTLRLGNNDHSKRCDATVLVDGKEVGCWRINAGETITIERPTDDTGRFTFFKADSEEAAKAGVEKVSVDARGLIQVTFRPERRNLHQFVPLAGQIRPMGMLRSLAPEPQVGAQYTCDNQSVSSGITGLTGSSNQAFYTVSKLDYDPSGETVISIRLVSGKNEVRELRAAPRANVVPSPV